MLALPVEHREGDLMVRTAGVIHADGIAADDRPKGFLEREATVAGRVYERPVDVPENQEHPVSLPDCARCSAH